MDLHEIRWFVPVHLLGLFNVGSVTTCATLAADL